MHIDNMSAHCEAGVHGLLASVVEKGPRLEHGFVLPKMGEDFFEFPRPRRRELTEPEGSELFPGIAALLRRQDKNRPIRRFPSCSPFYHLCSAKTRCGRPALATSTRYRLMC